MNEILVAAKSEKEEALNIIIESSTSLDRTFPGVGSGNVSDLKVSLVLLGYNTEDSSKTQSVDNKLVWSSLGSGPTSKEKNGTNTSNEKQGESAVLFSIAGFAKNNLTFWDTIKSDIRLGGFASSLLVDSYKKSKVRIHRVFYVADINEIEPFVSLFLPLLSNPN